MGGTARAGRWDPHARATGPGRAAPGVTAACAAAETWPAIDDRLSVDGFGTWSSTPAARPCRNDCVCWLETRARHSGQLWVGFDAARDLVAVDAAHRSVGEDDVGHELAGFVHGGFPVVYRHDARVFTREGHFQDSAHRRAVVSNQDLGRHSTLLCPL